MARKANRIIQDTLTQERLKTMLRYNPDTGDFVWLVDAKGGRIKRGDRAGCIVRTTGGKCYVVIRPVQFRLVHAHRLAYLYMTGEWPPNQVDHHNGNGLDNRWTNLRAATGTQNLFNRKIVPTTSGYRGVWPSGNKKFISYLSTRSKRVCLGTFDCAMSAARAWDQAARQSRGAFAVTNFPV